MPPRTDHRLKRTRSSSTTSTAGNTDPTSMALQQITIAKSLLDSLQSKALGTLSPQQQLRLVEMLAKVTGEIASICVATEGSTQTTATQPPMTSSANMIRSMGASQRPIGHQQQMPGQFQSDARLPALGVQPSFLQQQKPAAGTQAPAMLTSAGIAQPTFLVQPSHGMIQNGATGTTQIQHPTPG